MQASSMPRAVYCFTCLCGKNIETESTETVCAWCQREIRLVWPAETHPSKPVEEAEQLRPAV